MAIGDAAAAAGLHTAPDTQLVSKGAENHNRRGDELAAEKTARAAADTSINTAITNLSNTKMNSSRVLISATQPATIPGTSGRIWFQPV